MTDTKQKSGGWIRSFGSRRLPIAGIDLQTGMDHEHRMEVGERAAIP